MDLTLQTRLARYNQLCRGYDNIYRQAALEAGISFVPYYILLMLCAIRISPRPRATFKRIRSIPSRPLTPR